MFQNMYLLSILKVHVVMSFCVVLGGNLARTPEETLRLIRESKSSSHGACLINFMSSRILMKNFIVK